jgi:hypothetical protein
MALLLDILAVTMLVLAAGSLCAAVALMAAREDLGGLLLFATGLVLLRSCVDLLRPRSAG